MSDQPSIIRQDVQHSVTVSEGALVATSKPSDPRAPQIRQNLAVEDLPADGPHAQDASLPPATATSESSGGLIFERTVATAPEDMRQAPAAHAEAAGTDSPLQPQRAPASSSALEVPAPLTPSTQESETPVDQFLRERRLAAPSDEAGADAAAGPVFERSSQDHFETIAPLAPREGGDLQAPVFERSSQDRFEAVPQAPGRPGESVEGPALGQAYNDRRLPIAPADARPRGPVQVAPREGSPRPVAAPIAAPVPAEQARQEIAQAAQGVQQRIEETIGAADQEWVEMDFPARVVKLKIENDKVRVRLDQLEEMGQARRRSDLSA